MSSPGEIGYVENNSVLQGIIKNAIVDGITTSTWNPRTGGTSKTVFKGTQQQITDLANECQTTGFEYSIAGGHIWTIEVTYPVDVIINGINPPFTEPDPIATWELSYQPFEKGILELADRAVVNVLSQNTKDQIELKMKEPNNSSMPPWADDDVINYAQATVVYRLKRSGVEAKQGWVHSLKKTVIVSNNKPYSIPNTYNGKLFLKSEIKSTYSDTESNPLSKIPSVIYTNMPDTLTTVNYNGVAPNYVATVTTNGYVMDKNGLVSFIGWLEYPPEYQMISLLKVSISQHWIFNQWSAGPQWGLYDPAFPKTEPNAKWPITGVA